MPGYGCEDHFLEADTYLHSWESIASLLQDDTTDGILCDIGMPVMHKSVQYNCRVFLYNRKVILIRPKVRLAAISNLPGGAARLTLSCHASSHLVKQQRRSCSWLIREITAKRGGLRHGVIR